MKLVINPITAALLASQGESLAAYEVNDKVPPYPVMPGHRAQGSSMTARNARRLAKKRKRG